MYETGHHGIRSHTPPYFAGPACGGTNSGIQWCDLTHARRQVGVGGGGLWMVATSLAQQLHRNRIPADRRLLFGAYVVAVMVVAALLCYRDFARLPNEIAMAGLGFWLTAALAVLADAMPVTLPGRWIMAAIFPSIAFTFAIMLVHGLAAAITVQAVAVLVFSLRLRHAWWRACFNIGQYSLAFGLSYVVLNAVEANVPSRRLFVVAIVLAAATWFLAKYFTTALAIWLKDDVGFWRMALVPMPAEALTTGALLMLAPALMMQLQ